jgi:hypothetical protein
MSQLKESFQRALELGKNEIGKTVARLKQRGQAFLSFDEPSIRVKIPSSGTKDAYLLIAKYLSCELLILRCFEFEKWQRILLTHSLGAPRKVTSIFLPK